MGDDNNETLSNVNTAEWDFDDESFDVISDEAKEFISQLLIKDQRYNLNVITTLQKSL
jgi:myosin-light-chain kinase